MRIIESREALLVEDAIACVLLPYQSADWGYKLARDYAERYKPRLVVTTPQRLHLTFCTLMYLSASRDTEGIF